MADPEVALFDARECLFEIDEPQRRGKFQDAYGSDDMQATFRGGLATPIFVNDESLCLNFRRERNGRRFAGTKAMDRFDVGRGDDPEPRGWRGDEVSSFLVSP